MFGARVLDFIRYLYSELLSKAKHQIDTTNLMWTAQELQKRFWQLVQKKENEGKEEEQAASAKGTEESAPPAGELTTATLL